MIRFLTLITLLSTYFITTYVKAEDDQVDISKLCKTVTLSAYSAIANREAGMPREELESVLEPLSIDEDNQDYTDIGARAYLLYSLHSIIEEVYGYHPLSGKVYATFRGEICIHDTNGAHIPVPYSTFHPALKGCDEYEEDKAISCVLTTIETIAESVK